MRLDSLSKTFADVTVLHDFSLDIHPGEIWGLVGQNGCGKSTVVKVLSGYHRADPGSRIELADDVEFAFVQQDLALIDDMTVMENLAFPSDFDTNALGAVRWRRERAKAQSILDEFGVAATPRTLISELAAADRSLLAMARALRAVPAGKRTVLVLDEPTASLPDAEVSKVLGAMQKIAREGSAVLFISHRLNEVLSATTNICVLRDGAVIAQVPTTPQTSTDSLVELMLGRGVHYQQRTSPTPGDELLVLEGVSGSQLNEFSLTLRAGEIVGVTGLLGCGKSDLGRIVAGAVRHRSGSMTYQGKQVRWRDPAEAIAAGIAYVPPERLLHGTVATLTARENVMLPRLGEFCRKGFMRAASESADATAWMDRVGVVPRLPEQPIRSYSGGNQQKLVFARWLRTHPPVLVLDEPTQAVDVGAAADIERLVLDAARQGAAVLVISSEWEEVTRMCDRALVLHRGRCVASLAGQDLTVEALAAACHAGESDFARDPSEGPA